MHTPLLQTNGTHHNHDHDHHGVNDDDHEVSVGVNVNVVSGIGSEGEEDETLLDKSLQRLDFYLTLLGFNQRTTMSFVMSWVVFLFVGLGVPMMILELKECYHCEKYQVKEFEYDNLVSQALLTAVSLICVSNNLRTKGLRKLLFVDKYKGHTSRFMTQYIQKIEGSYRMLLLSLIPCCILKAAHESIRILYVQNQSWWQAGLIVSAFVISWTYKSAITLVACILFHLACSLQVIHFHDYAKHLERESNIVVLMEEHLRLRHNLTKISHRFRIYLLLVFLLVTSSLCVTLVQVTGAFGKVTFLNGGNFAVTSIVQVVETLLCLHAGTKISHKAQGIAAVACKWHTFATCGPLEGTRGRNSDESINRSISVGSLPLNCSETDLESMDCFSMYTRSQVAVSSYNQRQSFVMYLQTNPGGITLYGWTVDRSLLTTIFFIELSLVLFVLGQTIIFTSAQT